MTEVPHALARLRREPLADLPISDCLHQLLAESGHAWRERLLPPLVTLRLFLIQVLSGNVAICALRQLAGLDFAPSSYCQARARMPLQVLQSLLHWLHEQARLSLGIATTLTDRVLWPDEKIAQLYGQRWAIETCFNHLKTTMKMNVLRCTSVDGVMKELAIYLAAYNLVRLAMLKAAQRQRVSPDRISFIDAMRYLAARLLGLQGVQRLIVNPDRAGRSQLRVIRRRPKQYDILKKPRREAEAEIAAKQAHNR